MCVYLLWWSIGGGSQYGHKTCDVSVLEDLYSEIFGPSAGTVTRGIITETRGLFVGIITETRGLFVLNDLKRDNFGPSVESSLGCDV